MFWQPEILLLTQVQGRFQSKESSQVVEMSRLFHLGQMKVYPVMYSNIHPFSTIYPVRGHWRRWSLSHHLGAKAG